MRALASVTALSPDVFLCSRGREVMVGHSNTRWHWTSRQGDPEPAIPWCGFLYPDGSPVSYTEAAAIRRYTSGGKDDPFLFLTN